MTPRRHPPPDFVEEFSQSMPETYRIQYSEEEVRHHAGIVWRRKQHVAHVEQWPSGAKDATWLCVVTDDRPGLLSLLCTALTAHSLSIVSAKIHCRAAQNEAVDFFCVRPLKSDGNVRLSENDLQGITSTIVALLQDQTDIKELERKSSPTSRPPARPETSVYFDGERDGASLMVMESDDRLGLLTEVTRSLAELDVRIAWSDVVTIAGRARDEFLLTEADGRPLGGKRQQAVVAKVVKALSEFHLVTPE
jgi:[protein-PII] uridylyltransferase